MVRALPGLPDRGRYTATTTTLGQLQLQQPAHTNTHTHMQGAMRLWAVVALVVASGEVVVNLVIMPGMRRPACVECGGAGAVAAWPVIVPPCLRVMRAR